MWEEFTQSIHTFTEDKKNLAQHTLGKKKATLIVIPSVRFTKLIIFHLQRKHKFHPRPESPLHLPTEEPILGYLKFSAKGTKREVFGMPIPNELITDDIRGADYYDAYLKKVAKHQRYLAGEEVSDPDSPAPKPAKSTKTKITKQAKPVAPKAATKKPQPAPIKPKEKKRKQAKETTEATPPAKRAKAGKVAKKRTLKKSQQLVDEFVDEGIPLTEPGFGDLEADTQRAIEESLKDDHGAHLGPLPPVVFKETDTGKYQPLPEVEGKEKEKVGAEQAARVLLNLQTPKKKSPTEQYIFQRRTSAPTEPSGHDESSSLYAELGLTESGTESDEEVPPVVKSGAPDEGQAGPNPIIFPLQERTLSSLQHLAKDFSFGDQFFNDKPSEADNEKDKQPDTKLINGFTAQSIKTPPSAIAPLTSPLENQDIPNQVRKAVDESSHRCNDWLCKHHFRPEITMTDASCQYLAEARKKKKKRHGSPKTPPGSPPHPPSPAGPSGTSGAFGASGSSQSPPPPPPPPNSQDGQSTSTATPSSSKTAASLIYA
ncbi:hypothetical protein Tco_0087875 [Tanacetum coccineum]